ncbi:MAG: hypothetical protein ABL886_12950 [Rhodoglobus sp.]
MTNRVKSGHRASKEAPVDPDVRVTRGRRRGGASFPIPPSQEGLPAGYATTLTAIRDRIGRERLRVVMTANASMVHLYWDIGQSILRRQQREGWRR